MNPGARAAFVAAYGRLVTSVWSDPEQELLLERDPRALMAQYGLMLPATVRIEVVRHVQDAEPDLDAQVAAWENAPASGHFALVVPATDADDDVELAEHELDGIVAGLDTSCACCCPCCCTV
jgi:hypothetical protein